MSKKIIWFCQGEAESVGSEPMVVHIQSDVLQVYVCRIPRYYAIKKHFFKRTVTYTTWNKAALLQTMQNCCLTLCADKYYVDAQFADKELSETVFYNEKQRILEELLEESLGKLGRVNQILWIPGTESIHRNIPMKLLWKLQKFYVLNEDGDDEKWEMIRTAEEFLWDEYGMPLMHIDSLQEISCQKDERLLILNDTDKYLPLNHMQCKILYFDLWSDETIRKRIERERPDAKYFSEYCYLQKMMGGKT